MFCLNRYDQCATKLNEFVFIVRLESVADKLHVKLMQIIVNSCCPTVAVSTTSGASNNKEAVAQVDQGRVLLNYCPRRPSCIIRHPEVAVREMLTKLVQLMKGKYVLHVNVCFIHLYSSSHSMVFHIPHLCKYISGFLSQMHAMHMYRTNTDAFKHFGIAIILQILLI